MRLNKFDRAKIQLKTNVSNDRLEEFSELPCPTFIFKTVETNETLSTHVKIAFRIIIYMWMMPVTDIAVFRKSIGELHIRTKEYNSENGKQFWGTNNYYKWKISTDCEI